MAVTVASPITAPALAVEGLVVKYSNRMRPAIRGVSFTLPRGSYVAVVGPNGAGKTTLFKALLGLVPVSQGRVRVLGRAPKAARSQVAYVPQREAVDWQFPLLVTDVVMMGRASALGCGHRPGPADHRAVEEALTRVEMWSHRSTPIAHLSGGQQQRVFLARAIAQEAQIYLLDEPFNEVDARTQQLLLEILEGFVAEQRSVMVATHDLYLARRRFPQVLLLNGKAVALGSPAQVFQPGPLHEAYGGQPMLWQPGSAGALTDGMCFSLD